MTMLPKLLYNLDLEQEEHNLQYLFKILAICLGVIAKCKDGELLLLMLFVKLKRIKDINN